MRVRQHATRTVSVEGVAAERSYRPHKRHGHPTTRQLLSQTAAMTNTTTAWDVDRLFSQTEALPWN
jgi:hypothetical protein